MGEWMDVPFYSSCFLVALPERLEASGVLEKARETFGERWCFQFFVGRFSGDHPEYRVCTAADFSTFSHIRRAEPENDTKCECSVDGDLGSGCCSSGGRTCVPGTGLSQAERLSGKMAGHCDFRGDVRNLPWQCGTGNLCVHSGNSDGNIGGDDRDALGKHIIPHGSKYDFDSVLQLCSADGRMERWNDFGGISGASVFFVLGRKFLFFEYVEKDEGSTVRVLSFCFNKKVNLYLFNIIYVNIN